MLSLDIEDLQGWVWWFGEATCGSEGATLRRTCVMEVEAKRRRTWTHEEEERDHFNTKFISE
jgi:hypothetical protein